MTRYRIDAMGRRQATRKTTQPERDRRNGWIIKLWRRGHSSAEICDALDISPEIVRETLHDHLGETRPKRYKGAGPVTEPCPWRDDDVPYEERGWAAAKMAAATESRWRQSRIVGMAQMLNDEYRESNFANILANQATAAEEGGDRDWLVEASAVVNAAIEKLERARRILADDNYRTACRDTLEGVEQMRNKQPPNHPLLRAVPTR